MERKNGSKLVVFLSIDYALKNSTINLLKLVFKMKVKLAGE